jgi:hypothetical protein
MKAEVAQLLRQIDKSPVALPHPIVELHVEEWQAYYEFFVAIAHHGRKIPDQEFISHCSGMERYLLNLLRPQTFRDIDELESLIREAEQHD